MQASLSSYTATAYIDLQPDYSQVLHDVSRSVVQSEAFWCSGYLEGRPSVHGKVRPRFSGRPLNIGRPTDISAEDLPDCLSGQMLAGRGWRPRGQGYRWRRLDTRRRHRRGGLWLVCQHDEIQSWQDSDIRPPSLIDRTSSTSRFPFRRSQFRPLSSGDRVYA